MGTNAGWSTPSLPAWERGLKLQISLVNEGDDVSLPAWERGLKPLPHRAALYVAASLPAWERGLKLRDHRHQAFRDVAPRVGAWIETIMSVYCCSLSGVAPRVGAWIETLLVVAS